MASKLIKMCHFPVKSQYRYYIRVAGHMRGWLRVFMCLFNTFLEKRSQPVYSEIISRRHRLIAVIILPLKNMYTCHCHCFPICNGKTSWIMYTTHVFFVMIPLYLKSIVTSIIVVFIILKYCIVINETRGRGIFEFLIAFTLWFILI